MCTCMPACARPAHTRGPTCLLHVLLQKPAAGSVHMSQHTCSCWVDDSLHSDCQSRTTTHIPAAWESVLPDTVSIFVLANQLESLSSVACIHLSCHCIHYCTIHIHVQSSLLVCTHVSNIWSAHRNHCCRHFMGCCWQDDTSVRAQCQMSCHLDTSLDDSQARLHGAARYNESGATPRYTANCAQDWFGDQIIT